MTDSVQFEALFREFPELRPVDDDGSPLHYDGTDWWWGDAAGYRSSCYDCDALAHCRADCYRRGAERGMCVSVNGREWVMYRIAHPTYTGKVHDSETSTLCAMVRAGGAT